MTGSDFYAYILRTFKRTDKSTEAYEAMTDTVMDMRLRFYPESFKTVSSALTGCTTVGQYSLTLPSDFGHLVGEVTMLDSNGDQSYDPLVKISIEEYDRLYPYRQLTIGDRTTYVPQHFCIYGGNIFVPPVDRTTFEFYINYTQEDATSIAAGTASVPFTDKYREVVKNGVLMRMYRDVEMYQEADIREAKYEEGIQKIIANDEVNTDATTSTSYSGV